MIKISVGFPQLGIKAMCASSNLRRFHVTLIKKSQCLITEGPPSLMLTFRLRQFLTRRRNRIGLQLYSGCNIECNVEA